MLPVRLIAALRVSYKLTLQNTRHSPTGTHRTTHKDTPESETNTWTHPLPGATQTILPNLRL